MNLWFRRIIQPIRATLCVVLVAILVVEYSYAGPEEDNENKESHCLSQLLNPEQSSESYLTQEEFDLLADNVRQEVGNAFSKMLMVLKEGNLEAAGKIFELTKNESIEGLFADLDEIAEAAPRFLEADFIADLSSKNKALESQLQILNIKKNHKDILKDVTPSSSSGFLGNSFIGKKLQDRNAEKRRVLIGKRTQYINLLSRVIPEVEKLVKDINDTLAPFVEIVSYFEQQAPKLLRALEKKKLALIALDTKIALIEAAILSAPHMSPTQKNNLHLILTTQRTNRENLANLITMKSMKLMNVTSTVIQISNLVKSRWTQLNSVHMLVNLFYVVVQTHTNQSQLYEFNWMLDNINGKTAQKEEESPFPSLANRLSDVLSGFSNTTRADLSNSTQALIQNNQYLKIQAGVQRLLSHTPEQPQ